MKVEFTEFVRPNGEPRPLQIEVGDEFASEVEEILAANLSFEAELLRTGMVSLTVADRVEEIDVEIVLVSNPEGGDVLAAIRESAETLIRNCANRLLNGGYE